MCMTLSSVSIYCNYAVNLSYNLTSGNLTILPLIVDLLLKDENGVTFLLLFSIQNCDI